MQLYMINLTHQFNRSLLESPADADDCFHLSAQYGAAGMGRRAMVAVRRHGSSLFSEGAHM